jgi:predicted alpha/beta-hydrolase family hydrolase
MKPLLTFLMLVFQCLAGASFAADYAREKKWADEVVPSIVVGDPLYLKQANGHEFLTLFTPVKEAKSAVLIAHGLGIHPDWGLIGVLRAALADAGYTTLSIQMPVLANEATGKEYPPTFAEARERLQVAVEFLKARGYSNIAILSHSLGSGMTYGYFANQPDAAVKAWVNLGMAAFADTYVDLSVLKLPVLFFYGERDLPEVLANVSAQKQKPGGGSRVRLQMMPGADHFFTGMDKELLAAISGYLKEVLGN